MKRNITSEKGGTKSRKSKVSILHFGVLLLLLASKFNTYAGCGFPQVIVNGKSIAVNNGTITYDNYGLETDTIYANICTGASAILNFGRSNYGPGTWSTSQIADSITVTSNVPGTFLYSADYFTTNSTGCGADSFHIYWVLTFVPVVKPTINLQNNQTLLACDTLLLTPTINDVYPPFTYSWTPDVNGQDSLTSIYKVNSIYSQTTFKVIVTDSIGCTNTDSVIVSPQLTAPIQTVASITGCEVTCNPVSNCNYQWYYSDGSAYNPVPNATSYSYAADSTGDYYVVINSSLYPACHSFLSNTISKSPYQNQQICIVTLDSTNTYNMVVWDKTPGLGIEYFKIYKLSDSTSQYVSIGEQPYSAFSTFKDTTSMPSQFSSSYEISIVDSCNDESSLSPNHTTILLSSSLGTGTTVNLSWNPYVGFTYSNFEIWRGSGGGSMSLLATVSNTTYAYIDNNPPAQPNYQVQVTNPNGCNPSRSMFDYSTVRSNIVTPSPSGIDNITNSDYAINLYPNPSDGIFKVQSGYVKPAGIKIYNDIGALIYESKGNIADIDLSNQPQGNYIALIQTVEGSITKKLVVQ